MTHEIKKGEGENPSAQEFIVPSGPGQGSTVEGLDNPDHGPEDDKPAAQGKSK